MQTNTQLFDAAVVLIISHRNIDCESTCSLTSVLEQKSETLNNLIRCFIVVDFVHGSHTKTSYKDRSTNQIAGNSLFSSEIILNIYITKYWVTTLRKWLSYYARFHWSIGVFRSTLFPGSSLFWEWGFVYTCIRVCKHGYDVLDSRVIIILAIKWYK